MSVHLDKCRSLTQTVHQSVDAANAIDNPFRIIVLLSIWSGIRAVWTYGLRYIPEPLEVIIARVRRKKWTSNMIGVFTSSGWCQCSKAFADERGYQYSPSKMVKNTARPSLWTSYDWRAEKNAKSLWFWEKRKKCILHLTSDISTLYFIHLNSVSKLIYCNFWIFRIHDTKAKTCVDYLNHHFPSLSVR